MDDTDRRVTIRWNDASIGESVVGSAVARPGYGAIVMGPHQRLHSIRDRLRVGDRTPTAPGRSAKLSKRCRRRRPTWFARWTPFLLARRERTVS
jgi:hypothetical protein